MSNVYREKQLALGVQVDSALSLLRRLATSAAEEADRCSAEDVASQPAFTALCANMDGIADALERALRDHCPETLTLTCPNGHTVNLYGDAGSNGCEYCADLLGREVEIR